MYIRIHTHTTHVGCALYLLKESGGIFFFGMDHNTWCQLFSRTVGKHRGVAIPHPSPPQTVLCQCYQNKWHILFFYVVLTKKLQVLMQLYITASCETNKCYSCESHTSDHILVILSIRKMITC